MVEEEEQLEEEDDANLGDEDEMADFVDEEEVDENGAPVRRRKPNNRKKSRQALGVSSSALQETHDIFGDVDELLMLCKKGLAKSSRLEDTGVRLDQEFEPFILTEKYMTEKDEIIRETDLPERMQMLEESTGPAPTDDLSIEEEDAWIHNQLITNYKGFLFNDPDELVPNELSTKIKEDIV